MFYFSKQSAFPERLAPPDRVVIKEQSHTKEDLRSSSREANAHPQLSVLIRRFTSVHNHSLSMTLSPLLVKCFASRSMAFVEDVGAQLGWKYQKDPGDSELY
jgi:hypothetical protein